MENNMGNDMEFGFTCGSSLISYGDYSTTAGALEQAVRVRRPWWEVFEKLHLSHSSGSGSKDHACPLGPGATSARLLLRAWIETLWVVT